MSVTTIPRAVPCRAVPWTLPPERPEPLSLPLDRLQPASAFSSRARVHNERHTRATQRFGSPADAKATGRASGPRDEPMKLMQSLHLTATTAIL